MSVLITFIKLISVFDLLVIAVYFGGDILSTMLNKLRRTPKQDDPFDFSLDTVTVPQWKLCATPTPERTANGKQRKAPAAQASRRWLWLT